MENKFDLMNIQGMIQSESAKQEVRESNDLSERFGLSLSEKDIQEIVECRSKALKDTGRIEFGGGIMPKLVYAFCDSPFMDNENYAVTLEELQELFYYYKNESEEALTDDELIEFMVKVFNGRAQGSTEYLGGISVDALYRYAKREFDPLNPDDAGDLF